MQRFPDVSLIQNQSEHSSEPNEDPHHEEPAVLSADMQALGHSFPFLLSVDESVDDVLRSLKSGLPSPMVVQDIVNTYFTEAGWM
jgi:hypothetical protein